MCVCVCVFEECPFQNLNQIKFLQKKREKKHENISIFLLTSTLKKRRAERKQRVEEGERGRGRYKRIASALCFVVMAACGQNA